MAEFLLELFSEEIPARMQARAAEDLKRLVTEGLGAAGLTFALAEAYVTPRRLTVVVEGLPLTQPDVVEERKGPRVDAPQAAIDGFLKSAGVTLDQCEQRDTPKGKVWFALIRRPGGPTATLLDDVIADAATSLPWPKSMRWGESTFTYVRPLQSILAVFDGQPIYGRLVNIPAGLGIESPKAKSRGWFLNRSETEGGGAFSGADEAVALRSTTQGHRFLAPGPFAVSSFADYREKLLTAKVVLDREERKAIILANAGRLAAAEGLALRDDPGLLEEVAGLVEWPVVHLGRIDDAFMDVPPEVLTTSMRTHQRYFALQRPDGALAPRFAVVANTETVDGGATVVAGNERVLRARLSDAKFFWDQDRKIRLADRVKDLEQITFHARLGTVAQKVERTEALAAALAERIPGADPELCRRAARLAKADLTTGMIGEFPELQGVMGRYYALAQGEAPAVADAIADHYKPLGPNDTCPTAPVSVAVALADKIDTLVGFFAIDEKPTGSRDPYALRRAALGIIRLIVENNLRLNLLNFSDLASRPIIETLELQSTVDFDYVGQLAERHLTIEEQEDEDLEAIWQQDLRFQVYEKEGRALGKQLLAFFADRLKAVMREQGVRHDLIDAVFAVGGEDDLRRLLARVEALGAFLALEDGANLLTAYRRAGNIVRIEAKKDRVEAFGTVDPTALVAPEERALAAALDAVAAEIAPLLEHEGFAGAMAALARLRPPVDAFFDRVTVNTDDRALRRNRLALLSAISATMDRIADFSKVEG